MLEVTERAAELLGDIQKDREEPEKTLRLVKQGGGYELTFDEAQEGDQVVTHQEEAVLLIDGELSTALDGVTVDRTDTPQGPRLTMSGPPTEA
jgi:Fe-S cluster assembly iron-binding protein IscA